MHKIVAGLLLGLALLSGCAERRAAEDTDSFLFTTTVSPGLLLNTSGRPGLDAQLFAFRSSWPSTEGYVDLGETVFYRVTWYDRQAVWPNARDYSYRLFQSWRTGSHVR